MKKNDLLNEITEIRTSCEFSEKVVQECMYLKLQNRVIGLVWVKGRKNGNE